MKIHTLLPRLLTPLREGTNVGLFLDYDGTLRDFTDEPEQATPDVGLLSLLNALTAVPHLSVALISGRPADFLEKHLGALGVTLVAEHGYRWLDQGQGSWRLVQQPIDTDWKNAVRNEMRHAVSALPGTHVEEKQSSLVWHFRKTEPVIGELHARSLQADLTSLTAQHPVTVQRGHKIIEVSSSDFHKGTAVDFLLERWKCRVALVAGDDQSDEDMISLSPNAVEFHAVKVGDGPSSAAYRTDIRELRGFLESMRVELMR